jgi:hypothetical protein
MLASKNASVIAVNVLAYQLSAPLARGPYTDLTTWMRHLTTCPFAGQVERAIWGGFHADRLGYAFVAGYTAALARLFEHVALVSPKTPSQPNLEARPSGAGRVFPPRPLPARLCLAATESGGAHPRAIATRLDKRGGALVLNGEKTFATLATVSDELLVVASRGIEADGKNRLRLVRIKTSASGVQITRRPDTPFAPEIPHAVVRFTDAVIENEDVLPGDGYDLWLKPFRTLEDTHVLAATVGYIAGAARAYRFDRDVMAQVVSLSLGLVDVAARDPDVPLTHVILAGLFATTRRLIGDLGPQWEKGDEAERSRWQRDLPLLMVAEMARAKRTEVAWERLSSPMPASERTS